MGICYYSIDRHTGVVSPKFWLRLGIALLIAFELFWYTSGFASNMAALFTQDLAWVKFVYLISGVVIVGEWVYHSVGWLARWYGIFPMNFGLWWRLLGMGMVLPFVFVGIWGAMFSLGFGKGMEDFVGEVSLMKVFLFLVCMNATCLLLYPPVEDVDLPELEPIEVLKVEAFYGGVLVNLLQADIAYVFYKDGVYYITSHAGVCYETCLDQGFEEFFALLDPDRFFMINEFAIVSRRACIDFKELEDGTIKVNLTPKPIMPKVFREGDGLPGIYDFLNWN